MDQHLIVGVPIEDLGDLKELADSLGLQDALTEQQYFDGAAFADLIVPSFYSAAVWATLRTFITTRGNRHKTTRVTYKGAEIEGMSPKDAARIIEQIESATKGDGAK